MSNEEPLMYSQFCYYIQKDEEKLRATMHIPRKPGEQIEVDWAGDPAHIIDPDTGEITEAWIFVGVRLHRWHTSDRAGRDIRGCRVESAPSDGRGEAYGTQPQ